MATVTTWTNVQVNIQSALGSALVISGITKADPGVVTSAGHGLSNGDYVLLSSQGMTELDGRVFRVANVTTDTFELENEDTTAYNTFSSGSAQEITFGTSLTTALTVSASGGDPNFIDVTTIHDSIQKQIPGNASAANFSFENVWDPNDAGLIALKAASDVNSPRAVHFVFSNGRRVLFNGYVSATLLPTGQAGGAVQTPVTITMFGRPTAYAS